MGARPTLVTRTTEPRAFARILRAALRNRLVHLPLERAPESGDVHELHAILEGPMERAVRVLAEPAGPPSRGLHPLRLQPRSALQASQLYALAQLGGATSSFPPDPDAVPAMRVDSEAPAIRGEYRGISVDPVAARAFAPAPLPSDVASFLPSPAPEPSARIIAGRYRLDDELGEGSAGTVHKGFDLSLGRVVAIKILHPMHAGDDMQVKRFRAEALAASRLDHVNVTGVLDFGEEPDGGLYLVMEFVAGRTLENILSVEKRLPLPRAVEIAAQVCAALARAHEEGIVHRDVKPENVMLLANDVVKVCDFGIAKFMTPDSEAGELTMKGTLFGSPAYMSPEQAGGRSLDTKSDLYSLGIVLYEMTTGRLPFVGETLLQIIHKHLYEPPPRPSALVPGYMPPLEDLVLRLLAKNPADRPPTAREVRAELRAIGDLLR